MSLLRLATPVLAAFTLFSACDLAPPDPNKNEADSERQEVGTTSSGSPETTAPDAESSTGAPMPEPGSTASDTTETDAGSSTGDDTSSGGDDESTGDEGSSTGAESSSSGDESSSEGSSTGEPEPIETCEQLDPAACETGMCAFDAELDAHVCDGEDVFAPGVVLHPQDAVLRHLGINAQELNVIELPNAGTFGVSVVPQGIDFDTGIKLFGADGELTAMSFKSGQDELEIQADGPSVVFLVVVGGAEIEGDYFVTVSLK